MAQPLPLVAQLFSEAGIPLYDAWEEGKPGRTEVTKALEEARRMFGERPLEELFQICAEEGFKAGLSFSARYVESNAPATPEKKG